jgi:hypothetical protein
MPVSPLPSSSLVTATNAARDPAADARRFVDLVNSGQTDEAAKYFASLMGSDDPNAIPPVPLNDPNSYGSALLAQVGAQIGMRNFAINTVPRLLDNIKIR